MNQNIDVSSLGCDVSLAIKREDLLHPIISGNKYRKLKYTIAHVLEISQKCMLTFGGAYSNHIAAVASAGDVLGFKTIGIIRGDELENAVNSNPTLSFAKDCGMQFKFVSRESYRAKTTNTFIEKLKAEQKNCIRLFYFENKCYQEISIQLKIEEKKVEKKEELWDDGMKIPDWLKADDEK